MVCCDDLEERLGEKSWRSANSDDRLVSLATLCWAVQRICSISVCRKVRVQNHNCTVQCLCLLRMTVTKIRWWFLETDQNWFAQVRNYNW